MRVSPSKKQTDYLKSIGAFEGRARSPAPLSVPAASKVVPTAPTSFTAWLVVVLVILFWLLMALPVRGQALDVSHLGKTNDEEVTPVVASKDNAEGIPRKISRIEPQNHPFTRPSAFAKATADKSDTLSPTGGQGWGEGVRFMESPDAIFGAHWDNERWGETPSSPDLQKAEIIRVRRSLTPPGFKERTYGN